MKNGRIFPVSWCLLGLLFACSVALPARAEGGSYPSATLLLGFLFLYTLGIPIAAAAAAYMVLKLIRRQMRPKIKMLLLTTGLTWGSGLALYLLDILKLPFHDDGATLLGAATSLAAAVAFGLWTAPATPAGPG